MKDKIRLTLVFIIFCLALTTVLFLAAPTLAPISKKVSKHLLVSLGIREPAPPKKKPQEPELPPLPEKFFPVDDTSLTTLFNGVKLKSQIKTVEGDIASRERLRDESYLLDLELKVQVPSPNTTIEDLKEVNPLIDQLVPGISVLLETAKVSPFYHSLYKRKVSNLRYHLNNFTLIPTRHNFFDCETILELSAPKTGRKALLIQSEMDVVTDGIDGDRSEDWDSTSRYFQPFTSYSWAKRTKKKHPLQKIYQDEVNQIVSELKSGSLSTEEKKRKSKRVNLLQSWLKNMRYRSSLVASIDPFIVIPTYMATYKKSPYAAKAGDYAVVIHKDQIYPAIVGDAGPNTKIGEASLLICKTINPQSSGVQRAVSDLTVTYLIFPRSRNAPFGPPNLEKWKQNCQQLLGEIGAPDVPLYDWTAHLAKLEKEKSKDKVDSLQDESNPVAESPSPEKAKEPSASSEQVHVVQPGDSLWKIAREYDTDVTALKKLNQLESDLIKEGQVLNIPSKTSP